MTPAYAGPQAFASMAAVPMAAANFGGTMVVGQDRNHDGIPDVLQRPAYGDVLHGNSTPPAYAGLPGPSRHGNATPPAYGGFPGPARRGNATPPPYGGFPGAS